MLANGDNSDVSNWELHKEGTATLQSLQLGTAQRGHSYTVEYHSAVKWNELPVNTDCPKPLHYVRKTRHKAVYYKVNPFFCCYKEGRRTGWEVPQWLPK